ncbi:hypothetical protein LXL04_003236 [Taraxacum kok-saghyz]
MTLFLVFLLVLILLFILVWGLSSSGLPWSGHPSVPQDDKEVEVEVIVDVPEEVDNVIVDEVIVDVREVDNVIVDEVIVDVREEVDNDNIKTIMSHSCSSGNKKVASSFLVCSEHLPESANKSSEKSRSRSVGKQSESRSNNPNYDSESSIESARPVSVALSGMRDKITGVHGKFCKGQSSVKGLRHQSCTPFYCDESASESCNKVRGQVEVLVLGVQGGEGRAVAGRSRAGGSSAAGRFVVLCWCYLFDMDKPEPVELMNVGLWQENPNPIHPNLVFDKMWRVSNKRKLAKVDGSQDALAHPPLPSITLHAQSKACSLSSHLHESLFQDSLQIQNRKQGVWKVSKKNLNFVLPWARLFIAAALPTL